MEGGQLRVRYEGYGTEDEEELTSLAHLRFSSVAAEVRGRGCTVALPR